MKFSRPATRLAVWLATLVLIAPLRAQTYSVTTLTEAFRDYQPDGQGYREPNWSVGSLAIDPAGMLYAADWQRAEIRRVSPDGTGSSLRPTSEDPPVGFAGIAIDAAGDLYVTEQGRHLIRKVSRTGAMSVFAGRADASGTANGSATTARFNRPYALAFDGNGNLLVADSGNAVIRKITPAGSVTTFAGTPGVFGTEDGPAATARFEGLYMLAVGREGNVFVGERGTRIRKITPDGTVSTLAGARDQIGCVDGNGADARFNGIDGLAVTLTGALAVTDAGNNLLRTVAPDGNVTTLAGQTQPAWPFIVEDGIGGSAKFRRPGAVVAGANGVLFLADNSGAKLRKATPVPDAVAPIILVSPNAGTDGSNRALGARTSTRFAVAAAGTPPLSYQWTRNGTAIPGATAAAYAIEAASATDEGVYSVTIRNAAGSQTSEGVNLRVYTPPIATFTTRRVRAGGSFLWGIASGAGQLVAVGTGGTILTSPDGHTWTQRDAGTADWLVGVTYGEGKFVVVGDRGTILVSTDAITWKRATASGTSERLNNVIFGTDRFVAVGERGTIVTSTDAESWTARQSGATAWLRGLVYLPRIPVYSATQGVIYKPVFTARGQGGTIVVSYDGEIWGGWTNDSKDFEASAPFFSWGTVSIGQDGVIYGSFPVLRAVGVGTISFSTSVGIAARFRGLTVGAEAYFATGENGIVAASPGALGPWATVPTGTTANLVNGVFHGNSLFIVGDSETILQSDPLYTSRLTNIATRGTISPGAGAMISGFVISGPVPKPVLLRAVGPTLGGFGVPGTLAAPVLTLFDAAGARLATNTRWTSAPNAAAIATAASAAGAFPFAADSADSALLVTLAPGAYTAQVTGLNDMAGVGLIEAYDASALTNEGSRAINISTRGVVGVGANQLIAGFVITGAAARKVLIRAVGPSLAAFGVAGALTAPQLQVFDSRQSLHHTVAAWSARADADDTRSAARIAGAFALVEDSADAAFVTTLLPGSWTVQVSGLGNTTGIALVEVYDLP